MYSYEISCQKSKAVAILDIPAPGELQITTNNGPTDKTRAGRESTSTTVNNAVTAVTNLQNIPPKIFRFHRLKL